MAGAEGSGPPRRVPGFGPVPRWALRRAVAPGAGGAATAAPDGASGTAEDARVVMPVGQWRDAAAPGPGVAAPGAATPGLVPDPTPPDPAARTAGREAAEQGTAARLPGRPAVAPFPAWPPPAARMPPLRPASAGDAMPAAPLASPPSVAPPIEALPIAVQSIEAASIETAPRAPVPPPGFEPDGEGRDAGGQYSHDQYPHDPDADEHDADGHGAGDLPPLFRRPERAARLRRSDDLGLRRALSDRLLPGLVAAMAFLAALALAGVVGAAALAGQWQHGAASVLTVQVPDPTLPAQLPAGAGTAASPAPRAAAALALLVATPGVASARLLGAEELAALLRPWLGAGAEALSLPLPAVIELRLGQPPADAPALSARLALVAPGTLVESNGAWTDRLAVLARSLQACAAAALLVVVGVAAAVVAVATRAGLSARRDAIEIVHALGATDGYIAGRFAARATLLATLGGAAGGLAALPVLLGMAALAAPFAQVGTDGQVGSAGLTGTDGLAGSAGLAAGPLQAVAGLLPDWLSGLLAGVVSGTALPAALWVALPALPLAAAAIGWATAQLTVRRWLRRLP